MGHAGVGWGGFMQGWGGVGHEGVGGVGHAGDNLICHLSFLK